MAYKTIGFEVDGGVARITLRRPEVGNALNAEMARELLEAALVCDGEAEIRAVLLTGAGKSFCVGGDLKAFLGEGQKIGAYLKKTTTYLHAATAQFARMDAPMVAAVNGVAAGAGFALACAADLAVAGDGARFLLAYTRAGLSPDGSSTYFLPRLVGRRRALELMLTNRMLSAAEALDWGLVNKVVADDALIDEAFALASALAAGPTGAFGATKALIAASDGNGLETQMELEGRAISALSSRPEGQEGMTAFLEKRDPDFTATR